MPNRHAHHPVPWNRLMRLAVILVLIAVAAPYVVPQVEERLAWLFERLSPVFIMVLVAALLAFILDPLVVWLKGRGMPRWVAIVITYVGLTALLVFACGAIVPKIVDQVKALQANLPQIRSDLGQRFQQVAEWHEALPEQVKEQLTALQNAAQEKGSDSLRTFFGAMLGVLGWMARGMIILVLSIYFLIDKELAVSSFIRLIPTPARSETLRVLGDVLQVLRAYLRGQIVVIGFVAVAVTIVLAVAGMPYALTIGTMAGILEVIPYFGAFAGAVPAVLWAFLVKGWAWGFFMVGFFILINQFEGHVVIPMVMGHNLEMRPATVLLSLLVGAELAGIIGIIVAVPVCRILQVCLEHGIRLYQEYRSGALAAPDPVTTVAVVFEPSGLEAGEVSVPPVGPVEALRGSGEASPAPPAPAGDTGRTGA